MRMYLIKDELKVCKNLTILLIISSLLTMVLGPLVRAEGAGLACPDWPLCHGKVVPVMDYQIFLEWLHRLVAGIVSLIYLIWIALVFLYPNLKKLLLKTSLISLSLLILQIVLGGLTITKQLDVYVVKSHLLNALLFLSVLVYSLHALLHNQVNVIKKTKARVTKKSKNLTLSIKEKKSISLKKYMRKETWFHIFKIQSPMSKFQLPISTHLWWVLCLTLLIFLQIFMGARVSVNQAGMVCNEFPACYQEAVIDKNGNMIFESQYFPPMEGSIEKHMSHRFMGYLLFLFSFSLATYSSYKKWSQKLIRMLWIIFALISFQIFIGAMNVIFHIPAIITVFHSFIAYTIYLHAYWLLLETRIASTIQS